MLGPIALPFMPGWGYVGLRHSFIVFLNKMSMPYANNKGADQPAHPLSLNSAFIVRCLDRIIPLVSISKIASL